MDSNLINSNLIIGFLTHHIANEWLWCLVVMAVSYVYFKIRNKFGSLVFHVHDPLKLFEPYPLDTGLAYYIYIISRFLLICSIILNLVAYLMNCGQ